MTLFDYVQSCSLDEFAEWLVEFQSQSEENVIEPFEKEGISVTRIQLDPVLQVNGMKQELLRELEDSE